MSEVLGRFEREYLDYHGISEMRRREVRRLLRELEVRTGLPIQDVPAAAVRAFVAELGEDRSPTTVAKNLGQIRPFFQWAYEASLIDATRLMDIKLIRPPRGGRKGGRPRPYNRTQIELLWRDWNRQYPLPRGVHDIERALWYVTRWENGLSPWRRVKPLARRYQSRAIIALAMMGGLRRDEVYHLDVRDLHHENAYVVVTSARKNPEAEAVERAVPWTTPAMREAVRDWLELRERIVPGHDRPWLSLASTAHIRTPLPHRTFEMTMTSLGRGWEFHRLRHTAATEMLRGGYPLETVQKIMGHAGIGQTLAYAELLTEDVVRVAGKCEMALASAFAERQPEPEAA